MAHYYVSLCGNRFLDSADYICNHILDYSFNYEVGHAERHPDL